MTGVLQLVGWAVIGLVAGRAARRAADHDGDRMASRGRAAVGPLAWDGAGVELLSALVLVGLAARSGWGWPAAPYIGLVATVAAVTITDLRHCRIPDRIVAAGVVATLPVMALVSVTAGRPGPLRWAAIGAVAFSAPLLVIHLAVPHGLGRGDVKLSVLLGAGIGWIGPPGIGTVLLVLWALIVACGLGLATALVLRVAAASGRPAERRPVSVAAGWIPFGPALSLGTIAVVVVAGPWFR